MASDGGVFSYGDAQFYGSTSLLHLDKPIVGIEPIPKARGTGCSLRRWGLQLSGMPSSPVPPHRCTCTKRSSAWWLTHGNGYWLVASDGGVFGFGNGRNFSGSEGGTHPEPARSWAWPPTPKVGGYWLVAADGGVFSFGTATFFGSEGRHCISTSPVVGMAVPS